jgi:DNA-binding MarR family transcriptional regulator
MPKEFMRFRNFLASQLGSCNINGNYLPSQLNSISVVGENIMSLPESSMENYVSYALAAAHRVVSTSLASRLKKHGVQVEAWRIMEALALDPELTMGDLAKVVLIIPSTLSKLVDRMVSDGLVHRQFASSDHRQVNLHLTDLGRKRMVQIRSEVEDEDEIWTSRLGPERASQLVELLRDLV